MTIAVRITARGAPVARNKKSENYWLRQSHNFPFQTAVDHMSKSDIDPRRVAREVTKDFLRVPFNGRAHFGFVHAEHLEKFMKLAGIL